MKPLLIILTFIFSIASSFGQKNLISVSIMQNGHETKIKGDTQTVILKKEEFKLLFNSFEYTDKHFYATHIDAFTDIKGIAMIHSGAIIDSILYFSPGTGLACETDKEYECLNIDKDLDQQHYITYTEKTDRRAKLEGKHRDTLRLSWTINKYSLDNKTDIAIGKMELKDLYIVMLNDFNLNGVIDSGEYSIIHVFFE